MAESWNTGPADPPLRAGDCPLPLGEAACARLVAAHGPMVKAACQRILNDPALAEDAAQEVFLLLVRKLPALPPRTILGGWLYVTACHVARTQQRARARRWQRESLPDASTHLMQSAPDPLWRELEPMLDDAMLELSERQRELVLCRYFQNQSQRAAAGLAGCSESVASRELARAIENMRRFFSRRGVTVSSAVLAGLLVSHGARASIGATGMAATLSTVSLAAVGTAGAPLFATLMKTTTTLKIAAAAALLIAAGTVYHLTHNQAHAPGREMAQALPSITPRPDRPPTPSAPALAQITPKFAPSLARETNTTSGFDAAAKKAAREREKKFWERIDQLFLMADTQKVQDILAGEFGIQFSLNEIGRLQSAGPKGFRSGLIDLWAQKDPRAALAFAASTLSDPVAQGWDIHQAFLDAARRGLPNLDRATLAGMLPDGPGTGKMLDLIEARQSPDSLGNRILAENDPAERSTRLKLLAQGWSDSQAAADWARQNLNGAERDIFYSQVGYNLAHQNPDAALQVLSELKGSELYAGAFEAMMRGLVQTGGRGAQAAELIANADVSPAQRQELISELSRRWVRQDPDAAIAWANSLPAPEDFRAAIPLLVSQLDNERVSRTVDTFLGNPDPTMRQALIEAAAPQGLLFDPKTSQLILDPFIQHDPSLRLRSGEAGDPSTEVAMLRAVDEVAKRQASDGSPAAAMEWLARLPFANDTDYARSIANVLAVWNVKSPADASAWMQNSSVNPSVLAEARKAAKP
ncbi:MAG TPA: sigma-70 family RNA polymerase sigma factor [Verrucomicrobiae bacterium]|nr:sigma-70 family RNA polymerase sigma factor [Verrucomicrobiae bacterium]